MENRLLFLELPEAVADPLGEVGGETSPALPCISSSAVHWPGGDALVEPFMVLCENHNGDEMNWFKLCQRILSAKLLRNLESHGHWRRLEMMGDG